MRSPSFAKGKGDEDEFDWGKNKLTRPEDQLDLTEAVGDRYLNFNSTNLDGFRN